MAITNSERVGKALDLLRTGLGPYAEREVQTYVKASGMTDSLDRLSQDERLGNKPITEWDAAALLKLMTIPDIWKAVFERTLGSAERSYVNELRDVRNRWAHQQTFNGDDTERALDTAARLLAAVSAPEAEDVSKMRSELARLRIDEQVRRDKRQSSGSLLESAAAGTLRPWRELVQPHRDVASGRYQQAEFGEVWVPYIHVRMTPDDMRTASVGEANPLVDKGQQVPIEDFLKKFEGDHEHEPVKLNLDLSEDV